MGTSYDCDVLLPPNPISLPRHHQQVVTDGGDGERMMELRLPSRVRMAQLTVHWANPARAPSGGDVDCLEVRVELLPSFPTSTVVVSSDDATPPPTSTPATIRMQVIKASDGSIVSLSTAGDSTVLAHNDTVQVVLTPDAQQEEEEQGVVLSSTTFHYHPFLVAVGVPSSGNQQEQPVPTARSLHALGATVIPLASLTPTQRLPTIPGGSSTPIAKLLLSDYLDLSSPVAIAALAMGFDITSYHFPAAWHSALVTDSDVPISKLPSPSQFPAPVVRQAPQEASGGLGCPATWALPYAPTLITPSATEQQMPSSRRSKLWEGCSIYLSTTCSSAVPIMPLLLNVCGAEEVLEGDVRAAMERLEVLKVNHRREEEEGEAVVISASPRTRLYMVVEPEVVLPLTEALEGQQQEQEHHFASELVDAVRAAVVAAACPLAHLCVVLTVEEVAAAFVLNSLRTLPLPLAPEGDDTPVPPPYSPSAAGEEDGMVVPPLPGTPPPPPALHHYQDPGFYARGSPSQQQQSLLSGLHHPHHPRRDPTAPQSIFPRCPGRTPSGSQLRAFSLRRQERSRSANSRASTGRSGSVAGVEYESTPRRRCLSGPGTTAPAAGPARTEDDMIPPPTAAAAAPQQHPAASSSSDASFEAIRNRIYRCLVRDGVEVDHLLSSYFRSNFLTVDVVDRVLEVAATMESCLHSLQQMRVGLEEQQPASNNVSEDESMTIVIHIGGNGGSPVRKHRREALEVYIEDCQALLLKTSFLIDQWDGERRAPCPTPRWSSRLSRRGVEARPPASRRPPELLIPCAVQQHIQWYRCRLRNSSRQPSSTPTRGRQRGRSPPLPTPAAGAPSSSSGPTGASSTPRKTPLSSQLYPLYATPLSANSQLRGPPAPVSSSSGGVRHAPPPPPTMASLSDSPPHYAQQQQQRPVVRALPAASKQGVVDATPSSVRPATTGAGSGSSSVHVNVSTLNPKRKKSGSRQHRRHPQQQRAAPAAPLKPSARQ